MKRTNPSFPAKNRGSALLIVLWSVMILAFAVAIASERVALIMSDASIRVKRLQAELLADTALASLESIVKEQQKKLLESKGDGKQDAFERPLDLPRFLGKWQSRPMEFEGGLYWIEIQDEQSKINWLKTPPAVWRNLLEDAGLAIEEINAWQDCLADWQDADDAHALNGAETAEYQSLKENRRKAKNGPVADMSELFWVMGGPRLFDLRIVTDSNGSTVPLLPLTTIYGDGKININTAPPVLIAAAMGGSIEDGEMVARTRCGPDGIEGTLDDVYLDRIPEGLIGGKKTEKPKSSNLNSPGAEGGKQAVPNAITTSSNLFRLRGVGEFQGQRVVREALAAKEGEFGLRLLSEPRTVENREIPAGEIEEAHSGFQIFGR